MINYIRYEKTTKAVITPIVCYPNRAMCDEGIPAEQASIDFDTSKIDLTWIKERLDGVFVDDISDPKFQGEQFDVSAKYFWDNVKKAFYFNMINPSLEQVVVYVPDNNIADLEVTESFVNPYKRKSIDGKWYVLCKLKRDQGNVVANPISGYGQVKIYVVAERTTEKKVFEDSNKYKDDREKEFRKQGVSIDKIVEAFLLREEGKPEKLNAILAKRAAIKAQFPNPAGGDELVKPVTG